MSSQSPADQSLETLQDIKRMMERSSRFISLSGLSGLCAGICALAGAYIAYGWIQAHDEVHDLRWKLIVLAAVVLAAALASSCWFTWRKARKGGMPIWDHASKNLLINMMIPLIA